MQDALGREVATRKAEPPKEAVREELEARDACEAGRGSWTEFSREHGRPADHNRAPS